MDIYLTNSLSRKKEKFIPFDFAQGKPIEVGMYTCGPTVYDYATIGNFRTYTMADLLLRTLEFNGYKVKYIMNLTDVGHLTGDNLGDADIGEDRLEKAAKKERKTAWDVAQFYINAFFKDFDALGLKRPDNFVRATDHIQEQINLVKDLEKKGITYKTSDGIYFDTQKYEETTHYKYGELSTLDQIKEGARVEPNLEKRNPRDFALWKFSYKGGRSFDSAQDDPLDRRDMEWDSPWGKGFPGWHIECSAMSMKYLGESFDIHAGGEDLRSTHHPNEIAQAQGVTGKQFVKYWIHGAFLKIDGGRMGKSLGNAYNVSDIIKRGFDPVVLRYFYLTGKYNEPLNFTWEILTSAQTSLERLKSQISAIKQENSRTTLSQEKEAKIDEYGQNFLSAINNDLNMPQALAVLWEVIKSNIPSPDKYDLILSFDEVLGLELSKTQKLKESKIPNEIHLLISKREELRKLKRFDEADAIRKQIIEAGFEVNDK